MSVINNPDYRVQIWDANDEVKEIRLITLNVWIKAIHIEMKTGLKHSSGSVATVARKFLGAPRYPINDLYNHLRDSLNSIHEQLGFPTVK